MTSYPNPPSHERGREGGRGGGEGGYTSPGVSTIAPLTQRSAHSAFGGAKACEFRVLQVVHLIRRASWEMGV